MWVFAAVMATALLSAGASASAAPAASGPSGSAKVFRPVGFHQATGAAPAAAAAADVNLRFNGGSVFTSPAGFIIFWGPEWNTGWTPGGVTSAQAPTYIHPVLRRGRRRPAV